MATETGKRNLIDIGQGIVPRDAATVVAVTDSTTGTASDTLTPITFNATWSQAQADEIDSNFSSVAVKLNEILTLLQNVGVRN